MPVDALRQVAGDQRPEQRPDVDAHVENREPGVAAVVALGIERADERADARLEQSGADDDQGQAGIEKRQRRERQHEVAHHDDHTAEQHAAVLPEPPVAEDAADDRRAPRGSRVGAVDRRGQRIPHGQAAGRNWRSHVEDEERPHPVITEPLPHLGEEQRRQPSRVTEEAGVVDDRRRDPCGGERWIHTVSIRRRLGSTEGYRGTMGSCALFWCRRTISAVSLVGWPHPPRHYAMAASRSAAPTPRASRSKMRGSTAWIWWASTCRCTRRPGWLRR